MVEISSGTSFFLAGYTASCGVLLIVAGASKVYRAARGTAGSTAISRALRIPRRPWRGIELAAAGVECAVGALACTGAFPIAVGTAMAVLGAVFCALLGYARVRRVPGGCGCVEWRSQGGGARISWRAIAGAAMLAAAGAARAVYAAGVRGERGLASEVTHPWFAMGLVTGAAMLALLSGAPALRTPRCHRGFWRPARATLRALTRHAVFAAMAESAGPLGPVAAYRRAGCTDRFWFPSAAGGGQAGAVVFQVRHLGSAGALAVQASLTALPATIPRDVPSDHA